MRPATSPIAAIQTGEPQSKRAYVRSMFSAIAPRYDLLNHLLSLNIDRRWRRRAVDALDWERRPDGTYLDLCAGTLDLSAELARRQGFRGRVLGVDFAIPMLRAGRQKSERVAPLGADALELPFRDATCDGCLVGFGVRNLTDLDLGLKEMARVVRPGGRAVILEFATPLAWPVRPLYLWYFQRVLPWVGRMVSRHDSAYSYLPRSVLAFPNPEELALRMGRAGFTRVGWSRLTLGVAALHVGVRA